MGQELVHSATMLFDELVRGGAALGWVTPPGTAEIGELLESLASAVDRGDAAAVVANTKPSPSREPSPSAEPTASSPAAIAGFGYWLRYSRATHRPHADLAHLAIAPDQQGRGLGGSLLDQLIAAARSAGIEQLTADSRGDNARAQSLWRSRGFVEYGRLPDFVAVGSRRYDKTLWVLDVRRSDAAERSIDHIDHIDQRSAD